MKPSLAMKQFSHPLIPLFGAPGAGCADQTDRDETPEETAGLNPAVLTSLSRARRQLRTLNEAYESAENKAQVREHLDAVYDQVRMAHGLLPSALRKKSWILQMEWHVA